MLRCNACGPIRSLDDLWECQHVPEGKKSEIADHLDNGWTEAEVLARLASGDSFSCCRPWEDFDAPPPRHRRTAY